MNSRSTSLLVAALLAAVLLTSPVAFAADDYSFPVAASEFSLSVGYANIDLGGSSSVIDNESALRIEGLVAFSPLGEQLPQLRLGVDVGVSMILDNTSRTIISNNGTLIFRGSNDVPFWLIEPELRISWRQTFGDHNQFFIEPGVAGGVAFGFLSLNSDEPGGDSFEESDSTVYGRVFLRAGAQVTGGTAGIECSYLSGGRLDFGADNAAGDLREFYVGVFGALLF
jgi:hypothetical protein